MNRCESCMQFKHAGPPYIDYIVEMTKSHDPEDHIWFCNNCEAEFYDWCDRVALASALGLLDEEE